MIMVTVLPLNDIGCAWALAQTSVKAARQASSWYIPGVPSMACNGTSPANNSGPQAPSVQYHASGDRNSIVRRAMDKIAFPYRSSSHLVLLHVVAESGAWEKHGLSVDYD